MNLTRRDSGMHLGLHCTQLPNPLAASCACPPTVPVPVQHHHHGRHRRPLGFRFTQRPPPPHTHRLRIQAVPHFIITAGPKCRTKYSLTGAQHTRDLLGAIEMVAMQESRDDATLGAAYAAAAAAGALRRPGASMESPVMMPC
jgi:hypothetical protein